MILNLRLCGSAVNIYVDWDEYLEWWGSSKFRWFIFGDYQSILWHTSFSDSMLKKKTAGVSYHFACDGVSADEWRTACIIPKKTHLMFQLRIYLLWPMGIRKFVLYFIIWIILRMAVVTNKHLNLWSEIMKMKKSVLFLVHGLNFEALRVCGNSLELSCANIHYGWMSAARFAQKCTSSGYYLFIEQHFIFRNLALLVDWLYLFKNEIKSPCIAHL